MQRRDYVLGAGAGGFTLLSGCLGGAPTDQQSDEAEGHIETGADHLVTAGDEFGRASGRLWDIRDSLEYSSETVNIAIDGARSELEEASNASPSSDQQTEIDRLETLLTAVEHIAAGYGTMLDLLERLDLMDSYTDAGRLEDASDELEKAKTVREDSVDELDQAAGALGGLESVDVEADIATTELRQRVDQTLRVLESLRYLLDGYEHELPARFAFDEGLEFNAASNDAADEFEQAYLGFDEAQMVYQDGEEATDTDLRQTFIRWVCVAESMADASEHSMWAVQEYADGDYRTGDEEMQKAREARNYSC